MANGSARMEGFAGLEHEIRWNVPAALSYPGHILTARLCTVLSVLSNLGVSRLLEIGREMGWETRKETNVREAPPMTGETQWDRIRG